MGLGLAYELQYFMSWDLRQSKVHVVLGPSQPLVNFVLGTGS
jgi:hypothetical protein